MGVAQGWKPQVGAGVRKGVAQGRVLSGFGLDKVVAQMWTKEQSWKTHGAGTGDMSAEWIAVRFACATENAVYKNLLHGERSFGRRGSL